MQLLSSMQIQFSTHLNAIKEHAQVQLVPVQNLPNYGTACNYNLPRHVR